MSTVESVATGGRRGRRTSGRARGWPIERIDADTALEGLYAEHYRRLVRLSVLLVRDRVTAEDVVQDCFVEVFRRWGSIDPAKAPAYLRQSVVNRSRSVLRHEAVVRRVGLDQPAVAPGADAGVVSSAAQVLDALATLPTRQREVLVLRHYEGLSEREIAMTLGISTGAVKSHASRGAAALRSSLRGLLDDHEGGE